MIKVGFLEFIENLDLFTDVVDWEQMQDFQLALFKSGLPHIDLAQDHAFTAALYKYANKFKIKTVSRYNGYIKNIGMAKMVIPLLSYK